MDRANIPGYIYLLHFDPPYDRARHYAGWSEDNLPGRMLRHYEGRGSPLVAAAVNAGCTIRLVRVWRGTRYDERALKNRKNHRMFCPVCRDSKAQHRLPKYKAPRS